MESSVRLPEARPSALAAIRARFSAGGRALWSGADAAAGPLGALIMTGGLVRTLGKQDYGLLVAVLAVSALSMAINPAIAATTTKYVSEAVVSSGAGDRRVARLVTASLAAVAFTGFLCLLASLVFRDALARAMFGDTVFRERPDVGAVLLLAVVAVCIQQLDSVLAAALKGLERFKEQGVFELGSRFVVVGSVVGAGLFTHDIHTVLAVNCLMLALSVCMRGLVFRSLTPERRVFARPKRGELMLIRNFGGWMWLSASASVAYGTLDRIMIARVLGPVAAAEYQIYAQLAQLIHYVPSSLLAFSFPAFSRLSAQGQPDGRSTIIRMYRKLLLACVTVAFAIAAILLACRGNLLHVLAGRTFHAGDVAAFTYLVCGFALLAIAIAPYYLLLGMGRSRSVSLIMSTSMAISVVFMPFMIARFGLDGAALARLIYPIGALLLLYNARVTIGIR